MAYLRLRNGKDKTVSKETGLRLWRGLQDPSNLSDDQVAYLKTVKDIYLNDRYAPKDYLLYREQRMRELKANEAPKLRNYGIK